MKKTLDLQEQGEGRWDFELRQCYYTAAAVSLSLLSSVHLVV